MEATLNVTYSNRIIKQLERYDILYEFESEQQLSEWILQLNNMQIEKFLSLNIDRQQIMFDTKLLIDSNLLNTNDYLKRVNAFISINNAEGYYHLFNYLVRPEFLNSENFYQDIETLKRAKCAQTPLWIIGEPTFINDSISQLKSDKCCANCDRNITSEMYENIISENAKYKHMSYDEEVKEIGFCEVHKTIDIPRKLGYFCPEYVSREELLNENLEESRVLKKESRYFK